MLRIVLNFLFKEEPKRSFRKDEDITVPAAGSLWRFKGKDG